MSAQHSRDNGLVGDPTQRRVELAAIHVARQQLDLTEEEYRGFLSDWTGKSSAAKLDAGERQRVIDRFRKMGFERSRKAGKVSVDQEDKPQVQLIKRLWLELHAAGKVKDPSLGALNKYVKRMTDVDHVNWLKPPQAGRLIESMKKWKARRSKEA